MSITLKGKEGQISSYPKKQGWGSVLCALLVDRKVTATVCFPPSQWYLELLWIISFHFFMVPLTLYRCQVTERWHLSFLSYHSPKGRQIDSLLNISLAPFQSWELKLHLLKECFSPGCQAHLTQPRWRGTHSKCFYSVFTQGLADWMISQEHLEWWFEHPLDNPFNIDLGRREPHGSLYQFAPRAAFSLQSRLLTSVSSWFST